MNTEQIAELREHLEELRGLLECETELRGETSEMADDLRASIAATELELDKAGE